MLYILYEYANKLELFLILKCYLSEYSINLKLDKISAVVQKHCLHQHITLRIIIHSKVFERDPTRGKSVSGNISVPSYI